MSEGKDPLRIVGTTQADNKDWWENHPMTYEGWDGTTNFDEDSIDSYRRLDDAFFGCSEHFAHPDPGQSPFSNIIDFQGLKGKRVLEIGCGMGTHAELLAAAGAELTAIDITERAVARTRKRFQLAGLTGQIEQMDAADMRFANDYFDHVWSWGVIHHSEDPQAIVRQVHRVLKPGGSVQVMVYNRNSLRYYVNGGLRQGVLGRRLLRESLYEINMSFTDGAIANHYTPREARRVFGGFAEVRVSVLGENPEAYLPALGKRLRKASPNRMRALDQWLLDRYGWFLFIEAKK